MAAMRELSLSVLNSLVRRGLRPGMRLPTEMEMTREFGVSRPTLRQALKVLEFSGLIASAPRRGTVLQQPDAGALAPLLAVQIALALPATQGADAQRTALAEARWLLERSVAPLAALRRAPADLAALAAAIEQFTAAVERFDEHARLAADRAFHRAYLTAAHNPVLDMLGGLIDGFFADVTRERPPKPAHVQAWLKAARQTALEHRQILAALTSRNTGRVERWIDIHLRAARRQALRTTAPNRQRSRSPRRPRAKSRSTV